MTVTSQQATMLCSICCGSVLRTLQDQDNSRPGCNHRVLAPCTSQQARSLMVPLMSGGGRVSTSRLASTAENVLQGQQQQHVYKLKMAPLSLDPAGRQHLTSSRSGKIRFPWAPKPIVCWNAANRTRFANSTRGMILFSLTPPMRAEPAVS